MDALLLLVLVGIPLAWLLGFAAYAYVDAPNHGMDPKKWAAISFFVPLFGFFAYLFEREEQYYDPSEDPYARGPYNVHESHRDDSDGSAESTGNSALDEGVETDGEYTDGSERPTDSRDQSADSRDRSPPSSRDERDGD